MSTSLEKHSLPTKNTSMESYSPEFRSFVSSVLQKRARLQNTDRYTVPKYMKMFVTAFTHKSFDPENNYELPEFVGDTIVNMAVADFLQEWDERIISVQYLTRLKHNIISKKQLSTIADREGFWNHIRVSEKKRNKYDSMDPKVRIKNKKFQTLLEDTFEAFVCTVNRVLKLELENGRILAIGLAINMVRSYISELNISIKYEDVFDAKSRLKELSDSRKWPFKNNVFVMKIDKKNDTKIYHLTIFGYVKGDKSPTDKNREVLAQGQSEYEDDVVHDVCTQAIERLKFYGVTKVPPNPFTREN